ncbi:MAG: sodium-dependent transporter, partial [Gemmatimonadota bacterium]|nr:sodium-dependent transporter [Gemmatimonadota bacterium]
MTTRETFGSRLGLLASMVGLAVGLGNVWRFPYMVGRFGGGAFILLYLVIAALVAVPALMGEWSLGRHTRRGPLGAYERAGMPWGRGVGWVLIVIVWVAVAYYTNAIGWVVFHWISQMLAPLGVPLDAGAILPPESGFSGTSFGLQVLLTTAVLLVQASVLLRGVRGGIEKASKVLTPLLFGTLIIVVIRSLTLPGAGEGIRWLFAFDLASLTPAVAIAALGQVVFSVGLGGTHMVVYGSYLADESDIGTDATLTVMGDTGAGLLAGLAIFPAVFAYGLEPAAGPGLLFATLPRVFESMPGGWMFGMLFLAGL